MSHRSLIVHHSCLWRQDHVQSILQDQNRGQRGLDLSRNLPWLTYAVMISVMAHLCQPFHVEAEEPHACCCTWVSIIKDLNQSFRFLSCSLLPGNPRIVLHLCRSSQIKRAVLKYLWPLQQSANPSGAKTRSYSWKNTTEAKWVDRLPRKRPIMRNSIKYIN